MVCILTISIVNCSQSDGRLNSPIYQTLHKAGCGDYSIANLQKLHISEDEAEQAALMRNAGTEDNTIIRLFVISRTYQPRFVFGDAVARMRHAGMGDFTILEIADYHAIPDWADDVIAMRNAGISDITIVQFAAMKYRDGKKILSGNEIASIKNTGFTERGLLSLAEHDLTRSQIDSVIEMRNEGKSELEILQTLYP